MYPPQKQPLRRGAERVMVAVAGDGALGRGGCQRAVGAA